MAKYRQPSIIYSDCENFDFPSHMNYGRFVLDRLINYKDRIALINGDTDVKITYGEMAQLVLNATESLKQLGVEVGDVVGICSENRTEVLTTAIAGFAIGAVVTFINSAYGKDELIHTTNISKPKFVFLSPKTYKSYFETMKNMNFVKKFIVFSAETISQQNVINFHNLPSANIDINSFKPNNFNGSEQTALILYSSGTTGLPKGAKLSHRNLIISGLQPFSLKRDLVCLSIAPWSNTVGIILTMDEIVYGQTVVYLNRFHEETYLKCIEKYKVGLLLAVPPLVVLLNQSKVIKKYDVTSVEIMYCGGAFLDEGVIIEAKKTFPNLKHILQGYGMTETTGGLTEEHEEASRQGSVGKIINGNIIKVTPNYGDSPLIKCLFRVEHLANLFVNKPYKLRNINVLGHEVVDVESRKILGPNKPGEVCVKGPALFQGYIGRDLKDDLDDDGFYKTGDIAYYDEDGYFYVVDRLKELIKYKAGQVPPSELEGLLRQHPAVKDVGVIGIPDPLVGELPAALVVKTPGSIVTEKELVDFVADKVSSWKQLRGGVKFVQEIPKTPSGKILRRKLRKMFTKSTSKL